MPFRHPQGMAENPPPDEGFPLTRSRMEELLDAEFVFTNRPAPVPADIRADWRIPLLLLIVKSCRGQRASLQQLQAIAWAAIFEESRADFLSAFRGEADPAALLIRYDPAVTRAINLAVGLDLLIWQGGSRLCLTGAGEEMLAKILKAENVLADERAFLAELGASIPMNRIDKMLGQ